MANIREDAYGNENHSQLGSKGPMHHFGARIGRCTKLGSSEKSVTVCNSREFLELSAL